MYKAMVKTFNHPIYLPLAAVLLHRLLQLGPRVQGKLQDEGLELG